MLIIDKTFADSIGLKGEGELSADGVGGYVLKDVPVSFFRANEGSFATTEIAGNLGVQIFRQFRTTFDPGKGRLFRY